MAISPNPSSGISAYTHTPLPARGISLYSYVFVKFFLAGILEQDSRHVHGVPVVRDHLVHESHGVADVALLVS